MQQVHLQHSSEGLCRNLYCLPSFIFCNPCQIPQKRGPARAKRSGQTHETARSSGPFADSIEEAVSYRRPLSVEGRKTSIRRLFWNRTCLHHGAPLLWQPLPRACRILPSWAKEPDSPESSGHGKSQAGPAGKAPPASRRCLHHSRPDGTDKNGICRAVHSRKGSADLRRDLLSPIPICRHQAFMYAISPKASFPPAVSVARYRQIAWPQTSPSSAWCRFPICACFLASLKRRICCTHIYTDRHCQPMLRFDICACPSPVMISCSE